MTIDVNELAKYQKIWLRCTEGSHNKEYIMDRSNPDDGHWKAYWGRIGAKPQHLSYINNDFRKKYLEKIKKGYVLYKAILSADYKSDLDNYFDEAGWDEFELE
jgi:hypothetical protein